MASHVSPHDAAQELANLVAHVLPPQPSRLPSAPSGDSADCGDLISAGAPLQALLSPPRQPPSICPSSDGLSAPPPLDSCQPPALRETSPLSLANRQATAPAHPGGGGLPGLPMARSFRLEEGEAQTEVERGRGGGGSPGQQGASSRGLFPAPFVLEGPFAGPFLFQRLLCFPRARAALNATLDATHWKAPLRSPSRAFGSRPGAPSPPSRALARKAATPSHGKQRRPPKWQRLPRR